MDKRKRGLDLPLDVQPLFAALLPWLGKETRKANDGKFYTFDEFVHDLTGAAYMSAFQSKVKDLISVSSFPASVKVQHYGKDTSWKMQLAYRTRCASLDHVRVCRAGDVINFRWDGAGKLRPEL